MTSRTIHAVLAGINEYRPPVPLLGGCLHDVNRWVEYLKTESASFDLKPTLLQNKEATKEALTSSLQNALTSASTNDVVFFFYSGHGTREKADPVFSDIVLDNALESLVCYDSIVNHSGEIQYNLLSDKELHYIISTYGKEGTHIIMVFDCCHSGGITRNAFLNTDGDIRERRYLPKERMAFTAPMRNWDRFIFGNNLSKDEIKNTGWYNLVPQKPHITLSACQNDESAYEQSGSGIFTSNLLDVLKRSKGSISYYDLQSRARLFIQNQFRQTPEVYAIRDHESDLLRIFLDKSTPATSLGCNLYYKANTGWVVDLGALHGITTYSGPIECQIGEVRHSLPVREVFTEYTSLEIPPDLEGRLDRKQAYDASVKNHFSGNTSFFFDEGEQDIIVQIKKLSKKWISEHGGSFSVSDSRANSSYIIRKKDGKIFICQNDDNTRPATEIPSDIPDSAGRIISSMRQIAQWEYTRSLCNPEFKQKEFPVVINFYRIKSDGTKEEIKPTGDTYEFDYDQLSSGQYTGKMKVSITNQSNVKYYCSILYLSNLFSVHTSMLDDRTIGLSPGQTAWIYKGDDLELDIEPHILDFNYPHSIFYLKLLASSNPFQIDSLGQSPLPAPSHNMHKGTDDPVHRGIITHGERAGNNIEWFTRTICFKGRNPHYTIR